MPPVPAADAPGEPESFARNGFAAGWRRETAVGPEEQRERFDLVCEDEVVHPDVFAAESPATSPVRLFRLSTHEERSVRLALARRADLPAKARERLRDDPDPEVVREAGKRFP